MEAAELTTAVEAAQMSSHGIAGKMICQTPILGVPWWFSWYKRYHNSHDLVRNHAKSFLVPDGSGS